VHLPGAERNAALRSTLEFLRVNIREVLLDDRRPRTRG